MCGVEYHIRIVKLIQLWRRFLKPLDFFRVHDLFFCSLKDGCSSCSDSLAVELTEVAKLKSNLCCKLEFCVSC